MEWKQDHPEEGDSSTPQKEEEEEGEAAPLLTGIEERKQHHSHKGVRQATPTHGGVRKTTQLPFGWYCLPPSP